MLQNISWYFSRVSARDSNKKSSLRFFRNSSDFFLNHTNSSRNSFKFTLVIPSEGISSRILREIPAGIVSDSFYAVFFQQFFQKVHIIALFLIMKNFYINFRISSQEKVFKKFPDIFLKKCSEKCLNDSKEPLKKLQQIRPEQLLEKNII